MATKKLPIEEAMQDRTGLVNVEAPAEIKETLYKGVAAIMGLLASMEKGTTFQGLQRDYITAQGHFRNFEKQMGIILEAPKKK